MRCKYSAGREGRVCEPLLSASYSHYRFKPKIWKRLRQSRILSACPRANEKVVAIASLKMDGERTELFLIAARCFESRT